VASLSQGRTAAAQCGLFTHKSVPVIFEPPCISIKCYVTEILEVRSFWLPNWCKLTMQARVQGFSLYRTIPCMHKTSGYFRHDPTGSSSGVCIGMFITVPFCVYDFWSSYVHFLFIEIFLSKMPGVYNFFRVLILK